ncbi:MAG: glycosyltransferase family 4 protein [Candidatus Cyclobacteriaceae bacterium M3_2C_046]
MSIAVHHPTGNKNVRAVISALRSEGLLAKYLTTIAVQPQAPWLELLPKSLKNELKRRSYDLTADKMSTSPYLEMVRLAMNKIGTKSLIAEENSYASVDAVYRAFDQSNAKKLSKLKKFHQLKAVYAYEDGAYHLFQKAKEIDLKCIYDLPIAYWETGRRLLMEEAERKPAWADTLGGGIKNSQAKLARKTEEMELADMIVCPSEFVKKSIPNSSQNKPIVLAPFGTPSFKEDHNNHTTPGTNHKPLRVLFVGSMTQRKGLGDLFDAFKLLKSTAVELVIMGSLQAPMEFYRKEYDGFTYEPGRPHHEVLELMSSCDVFCLPSIVEGRALVMQEAMSRRLPVIITPNTGGEDLVIPGETGFLVPIRSPEAIVEKINWFLENRTKISEMGRNAQKHAANYTWERYGKQVVQSIQNLLS